jgi:hypothetical protein
MAERERMRAERTTTAWEGVDSPSVSLTAPLDRVRWSSVLAGLFTTLASLIVLTVLGIAIGLSTFDAQNPDNFGIGAGIYGAIAAIISFALGGYMAARTTAVTGEGNGVLNGAMVWIVAIPLIVNLLGAGIGTLLGTATDLAATAATTAAEVAAPVVQEAAEDVAADPAAQATAVEGAEAVATQAQGAVAEVQEQVESITPQDVENVARDMSGPAWGALLALALTLAASALGGLAGTRRLPTEVAEIRARG